MLFLRAVILIKFLHLLFSVIRKISQRIVGVELQNVVAHQMKCYGSYVYCYDLYEIQKHVAILLSIYYFLDISGDQNFEILSFSYINKTVVSIKGINLNHNRFSGGIVQIRNKINQNRDPAHFTANTIDTIDRKYSTLRPLRTARPISLSRGEILHQTQVVT